jgi:hypothetical protein
MPHVGLPHVGMPHVGMPHVGMPRLPVPAGTRLPGGLLWLGGLGAIAALGIVEWPVAAAIAAGTWVAEHRATARLHEEAGHTTDRRG